MNTDVSVDARVEKTGLVQEFQGKLIQLSGLLSSEGVSVRAFSEPSLTLFEQLGLKEKQAKLKEVSTYLETCQSELSEKKTLKNTNSFVWRGLREGGFKFSSDMFTHLKDHHVIEVYDLNNKQVFRNLNFYDFVSYTLEDLYCRPWPELFHRPDTETVEKMFATLDSVLPTGQPYFNTNGFIPDHVIEERGSEEELKVLYKLECVFPVYNERRRVAGYLAAVTAKFYNEFSGANQWN